MRARKVSDNPHVKWTIDKEGNVTCEVIGVVGPSCTAATEGTEKALGVVISRTLKAEHSQQVAKKQTN